MIIELNRFELREIVRFAVECARPVLTIFERECPADPRPRAAIDAAENFSEGFMRTKVLRDCAWASHRAARETRDAGHGVASHAASAAGHAAGAAFLHPLPRATQVKHILGSAAHAARAIELAGDESDRVDPEFVARALTLASPVVVGVLRRYPAAPAAGGRVGELIRILDAAMREAG